MYTIYWTYWKFRRLLLPCSVAPPGEILLMDACQNSMGILSCLLNYSLFFESVWFKKKDSGKFQRSHVSMKTVIKNVTERPQLLSNCIFLSMHKMIICMHCKYSGGSLHTALIDSLTAQRQDASLRANGQDPFWAPWHL